MKKLLVLLMVLIVSSVAFGTLAIQPVGSGTTDTEIWVNPSDVFYIDLIWQNDELVPPGELSAADIHIIIDGPASVVDLGSLTFNVDYTGAAGVYNGDMATANGVILSVTSWNNGANPGEIIIDHIGIHCDGPEDVIIYTAIGNEIQGLSIVDWTYPLDLDNGGPGLGYAPLIVHQPEPMTIALLGLGGLFLRRRK